MPKFLVTATYNVEGARGLAKEGGSARRAVVEKLAASMGGKLEAFYFAYGDVDVYAIVDLPDPTSGLALSLAVNGSGAVRSSTVPLITPEPECPSEGAVLQTATAQVSLWSVTCE